MTNRLILKLLIPSTCHSHLGEFAAAAGVLSCMQRKAEIGITSTLPRIVCLSLRLTMTDDHAFDHIDNVLCDIGRMVRNPLQVS